jgi:hypothetical protein
MKRAVLAFLAGFLGTLVFHQPVLWLFHKPVYAMHAVPPFNIPAVISLAFWGGVWGIIMIPLIAKARGAAWWLAAIAFGAVFPTLVAAFVVMPLKGIHMKPTPSMAILGLSVNAAWGLGTAVFYRIFGGR